MDRGTATQLTAEGEKRQETWLMQTVSRRWMVLTDQRLLALAPHLMGYRLHSEVRAEDPSAASLVPGALAVSEKFKAVRTRNGQSRLRPEAAGLENGLLSGSTLAGAVQNTPLAQRVA